MKDTVKKAKLDYKSCNKEMLKTSQANLISQILKFTPDWGGLTLKISKI